MGKHKKVFKEAVSEMKHFLVGAGLVLTLVAVVPALAQTPPPGGSMPPPPSREMMPPPGGDMGGGGNMPPPGGNMQQPPSGGMMSPPPGGQMGQPGQMGMQQGGQPGMGMQQGGQPGMGMQQGGQPGMGMQQGGQQGIQGQGQTGQFDPTRIQGQGQTGQFDPTRSGSARQPGQGTEMRQGAGQQGQFDPTRAGSTGQSGIRQSGQQDVGQGQFPGQGRGVEEGFPGQGRGVEEGFPGQGQRFGQQSQDSRGAMQQQPSMENFMDQYSDSMSDKNATKLQEAISDDSVTIADLKKRIEAMKMEGTKREQEKQKAEMLEQIKALKQQQSQTSQESLREEGAVLEDQWSQQPTKQQTSKQPSKSQYSKQGGQGGEDFGADQWNQQSQRQGSNRGGQSQQPANNNAGNWMQTTGKTNTWDMSKFQKSSVSQFGSFLPSKGKLKLEIPVVDTTDDEGEQLDSLKSALNALAKVRSAKKLKQQAAAFAIQIENFCNAIEIDCENEFADLEDLFMNPSISKKKTLKVLKDVLDSINSKFEEGDFMLEEEVQ